MNFNTSPIAFFPSRAAQIWRAWFAQRKISVICGNDLLPFYIIDNGNAPTGGELYDPNTDTKVDDIDFAGHLLDHDITVDGQSAHIWIYQGEMAGVFGRTNPGYYYLKIGNWYSDVFRIGALSSEYTEINWQFYDDMITADGTPISKHIKYRQIFETPLWHPEYNIEEEGKTNNGIFYAMQQTTKKTSGFNAIVNESQIDCLNLTRMADNITVKACLNGTVKTMQTNQFEISSKWESDDVASIECKFDLFAIIRKYQQSNVEPEPLPLPTPPEPQTTYKIRGTAINGVNQISFVVKLVGETVALVTVPVVGGSFVYGYNKKIDVFSTGTYMGLTGSTTELKTIDFRESCLFSAATIVRLADCSNLESANFGNAKLNMLESVAYMFANCYKLKTLNIANAEFGAQLQNNNYQNSMFERCESLTTIDMPNALIAGANGADFSRMFNGCESLQTINMPLATFAGATDINRMFQDCESLTTLNMQSATFADAKNMSHAFYQIGLPTFNIGTIFPLLAAQPTNIENLLSGAKSATIDISALDLSAITTMQNVFENCRNATTITFDITQVGAVTNWKSTFKHCEKVTNLSTLFATFSFANALNVNETFAYTSENINLPAATFAAATNATGLFSYSTATSISIPAATFVSYNRDYANICEYAPNLVSIDMQSAIFGAIPAGHIYSWFYGCPALETINLNAVCTQPQVYLLVYSLVLDATTVSNMIKFVRNNNSTISIYQSVYDGFTAAEKTQIQSDLSTYAVTLDFA